MQAPSRQTALLVVAALLVAVLAWAAFRPSPLPVDVAAVERGDLEVTVDEEGETRVRERYVLAAPTTGRLLRIVLEEGDEIAEAGLVARIEAVPLDPRDRAAAEARLESAEARLSAARAKEAMAEATRAQAVRSERRSASLREAGTLSEEGFEQAQLSRVQADRDVEAAREAAHAAEHEMDAARAALIDAWGSAAPDEESRSLCADTPCVEVRSPVAGRVLRVREESERIVAAGTPLVEIGDPSDLEVVVDVLSTDAVRIRPGAPVRIVDWGGAASLAGRVRRVEPSAFTKVSALGVEEQRVNVVADLDAPAAGLGDGFRVEARIQVWQGRDLLLVPASALFRTGGAWSVFVVEDGVARLREVEVGERGTTGAEVRGSLDEGELVILHPSDRLADGARIDAR